MGSSNTENTNDFFSKCERDERGWCESSELGTKEDAEQAIRNLILIGRDGWTSHRKKTSVEVQNNPVAIRAAYAVADVLNDMHKDSYKMPEKIKVMTERSKARAAEFSGSAKAGYDSILTIKTPKNLPDDVSLDDAAQVIFGGEKNGIREFVNSGFKDIVVHEMGHILQDNSAHPFSSPEAYKKKMAILDDKPKLLRVGKEISNYATSSAAEFVAEAFVHQYRGGELSAEASEVYKALGGSIVTPIANSNRRKK